MIEENTQAVRVVGDNIENGARIRLDLKNRGLRVFFAYKRGGAYYIEEKTAPRTREMQYQITDELDILIKKMKEYAALHNWIVVDEVDYQQMVGGGR